MIWYELSLFIYISGTGFYSSESVQFFWVFFCTNTYMYYLSINWVLIGIPLVRLFQWVPTRYLLEKNTEVIFNCSVLRFYVFTVLNETLAELSVILCGWKFSVLKWFQYWQNLLFSVLKNPLFSIIMYLLWTFRGTQSIKSLLVFNSPVQKFRKSY